MPLILGANSLTGGYEVDNSLRFNFGSNDYLNRTASTSSDKKKYTYSVWLKRSVFTEYNRIAQHFLDGDNRGYFMFLKSTDAGAPDTMFIYDESSNVTRIYWENGRVFRDSSAWYHIVIKADSTQATESERFKVYLNGEDISSQFTRTTTIAQNENFGFQSDSADHYVGSSETPSEYFNGYMSETHFIDGQALDPTSFGEFDEDSGIWKPIAYTGTYGTNGFYLEFKDSSALGDDTSGNSNDFTVNNLTSIDQTTDTPTNNFATLNPLDFGVIAPAFSNGNLQYVSSGSGVGANSANRATFGFSTGKWYWELKRNDNDAGYFGATNSDIATWFNSNGALTGGFYGVTASGDKFVNGSLTSSVFSAMSSGDIGMFAYDLDNNYFYFGVNGTWVTSGDPTSGASGTGSLGTLASGTYQPSLCNANYGVSTDMSLNFGNPPFTISSGNSDGNGYGNFEYAVPSGYYALNTKNLADYG
jgi:hypothetical protein